jgi:lipopolysaccharide/colanic/teichoic acid biosynthesis glycosyltransferase
MLDVTVAGALLCASAPLLAAVAGLIRLNMGKPVLFRQLRPGKNGRPFTLYKFRTMAPESDGAQGVASDGARLTPLGRRLRALSLDELPTLVNVLRGEMSLVGPRPLLMSYLDRYTAEQARRHDVLPGITGWAQIHGRNQIAHEDKFALDVWYVDHQSFALDLKILWKTVTLVLLQKGITAPGADTMHEFKGQTGQCG